MSIKKTIYMAAAMAAMASQGVDLSPISSSSVRERQSTLTRKEQKKRQKKNKSASHSRAKNRRH